MLHNGLATLAVLAVGSVCLEAPYTQPPTHMRARKRMHKCTHNSPPFAYLTRYGKLQRTLQARPRPVPAPLLLSWLARMRSVRAAPSASAQYPKPALSERPRPYCPLPKQQQQQPLTLFH